MTLAVRPPIIILRRKQVQARTGLSRSTLYAKLHRDPGFPKPVPLGDRAVGWVEAEIEAWLQAQLQKSRGMCHD